MLSVDGEVRSRLTEKLKTDTDAPYHDKTLHVTTVSSIIPTIFPTLAMDSEETDVGEDLEGNVQVGISSMIQLKAFSEKSLSEAGSLLDKAGDLMIEMRYRCIEKRTLSDSKPFCKVARFQRVVGSGDFLYE